MNDSIFSPVSTNTNTTKRTSKPRAPKTLFALIDQYGIADTAPKKVNLMTPSDDDIVVKYTLAPVVAKAKKANTKPTKQKGRKAVTQ